MVGILYGNEPYIIMKRKGKYVDTLQIKHMNFQKYEGIFSLEVYNSCVEYPFMEERKVVLLEIENLSLLDVPLFWKYLEKPTLSTDLLIVCNGVDKKTKIFKKLNALKFLVPCEKMDSNTLKKAIIYELNSRGGKIQETALLELVKRLNYENEETVNMLSILGYIESLLSLSKNITLEMVIKNIPKYEEANVFSLSKLLLSESSNELLSEIEMMHPDESIGILSLLLRDFRIAYKLNFFDKKEISDKSVFSSFAGFSPDSLVDCMNTITDTIDDVKSGKLTNQQALKLACIKLFNITKKGRTLA